MSTPFQNRLVGTIIVAAIAIIFLPDVLDGEKKTYQDNFEAIPSTPQVDFLQANKSFPKEKLANLPVEFISDELALDEQSVIDSAKALKEKGVTVSTLSKEPDFSAVPAVASAKKLVTEPIKKAPSKAIAQQAWVIQLGSFRHQNNVDDLLSKLQKAGYTTFTKPIKTKNGNLTKVCIGPELIKSSLEAQLPALKKLTSVQGKVARFYPAK
ncbi:SPOR domain-containing protein [Colwellia sp. MB02u-6]|uniref:SPOR domain-containing protein n=1 Tax=Colwellia sp. MB02u-6 TaxID=2759824 RepID=UPI0015F55AAB|nr:SPOR domain-containing protein [Colwellia sp. MB02u-6]MBA6327172.1 SPOR domain-containing protein [Colwellia sp. MB02u-6]